MRYKIALCKVPIWYLEEVFKPANTARVQRWRRPVSKLACIIPVYEFLQSRGEIEKLIDYCLYRAESRPLLPRADLFSLSPEQYSESAQVLVPEDLFLNVRQIRASQNKKSKPVFRWEILIFLIDYWREYCEKNGVEPKSALMEYSGNYTSAVRTAAQRKQQALLS